MKEYLVPVDLREGQFSIVPVPKKAYRGMYIGEEFNPSCKECKQVLYTKYPDPSTAYEAEIGKYQRNTKYHKKGDPKLKTRYKEWVYVYSNILDAWKAVHTFPTVSYGLTNKEANVLVVDNDEEFESIEQVEKMLGNVKPTYIIRNQESKHIQFGFVMKEKMDFMVPGNRKIFNRIIKILARVFRSDRCFNGPACKNPFYLGFESKVYKDRIYERKEIVEMVKEFDEVYCANPSAKAPDLHHFGVDSILFNVSADVEEVIKENTEELNDSYSSNNINSVSCCSSVVYNTNTTLKLNTTIKEELITENHVQTYMRLLRNKIFAYFREFKQQCPEEMAKVFEKEVIEEMTNMGWVFNNLKQTELSTKTILKWCNTKGWARFGVRDGSIKGEGNSSAFQIRSRNKSLEVRRAKKGEKIRKYREWMSKNASIIDWKSRRYTKEGMISAKKAAELIGITYDEFRQYHMMELKGEISYETIDSTRSNSENEIVQGRVDYAERSSSKVEGRDETEEFGDRSVEEEIDGRISKPSQEIQTTAEDNSTTLDYELSGWGVKYA